MQYSINNSNPTRTHSLTVTFEQAVHEKSFYLKGLLQNTDEALGNIEVLFDAYNGIDIQGNKYLFSRPDTARDLQVWMVAMTSEGTNSRLSAQNRGIMGTDYELNNGKISFNTTNNGVSTNIAGFLFQIYPDNVNANTINVNHKGGDYRLYYPRFIKQ
jgi:hypothetical protein